MARSEAEGMLPMNKSHSYPAKYSKSIECTFPHDSGNIGIKVMVAGKNRVTDYGGGRPQIDYKGFHKIRGLWP